MGKYLSGTCSRAELDELLEQVGNHPENKELAALLYEQWEKADERPPVVDWDTKLRAIMRQTATNEEESEAIPIMPRWRWYAAAASILIIFVSGIGFWAYISSRKHAGQAVAKATAGSLPHDAQPGGNKAILTLANGARLTLDSVQNGSLGTQANMNVVKKAAGVLAYEKAGDAAGYNQPLFNMVSTPRGGQYQVVLPDGSKVWLNASSSIRFPTNFTGVERKVEVSGEAYFEIVKDPARPFKVSIVSSTGVCSGKEVDVLGTSFDVMAYGEENMIRTTLVDGAVKVRDGEAEKVLEPGEQAQAFPDKQGLKVIRDADVAAAVAWKNGYFNFNKENIKTVMRQLARWYDVEVSYTGVENDRLFWGGMQRDLPLSAVFKILEKSGVQFSINGKKVVVTM
jgi:transmembrane sensor